MKRKIRLIAYGLLVLILLLWANPALALPPLPHAFYGTLEVNGSVAGPGKVVSAKIDGVNAGSYTTTVDGQYGSVTTRDYLAVSCDGASDGDTINFYVNGYDTGQTATFQVAGGPTELNLTVVIAAGGGGGIVPAADIETNLFGDESTFSINEDGEIQETIEATSEEGDLTITIPEGTIALDEDGNPLGSLEIDVDENPPDPPEEVYIIGLAYDFGPDGATFDPPITITFTLDLDDLPDGVDPEDLVLAFWDGDEWVELDGDVDVENGTITITADVEHFTTFAVITVPPPPVAPPSELAPAAFASSSLSVSPPEVDIGKMVTVSILLSNTGEEEGSYTITFKINGVVEATREITLAGGASETVTHTTSKNEAGIYSVDVDGLTGSFTVKEVVVTPPVVPPEAPTEVKPETNWPVIGGIIGGVVIVGLLIFFLVRRKASA
ncbi:hypothetical protein ACFLWD_02270 [Chloroflexota bacterium]